MTVVQLYFWSAAVWGPELSREQAYHSVLVTGHFQAPAWGGWQIHLDA